MFGIKKGVAFFAAAEDRVTAGGAIEPAKKLADVGTAKIIFLDKKHPLVPTREELSHASDKKGVTWPVVGDDKEAAERIERLRAEHHSDALLKGAETGEPVAIPVREEAPVVDASVPAESVPEEPVVSVEDESEEFDIENGQVWKNGSGEAFVIQLVKVGDVLFPNVVFIEGERVGEEKLLVTSEFVEFVKDGGFVPEEASSDAALEKEIDAIEGEIKEEIDAIDKALRSHQRTLHMRAVNDWVTEEEWTKMMATLDQARADMDAAADLADKDGHEQEALERLKEIKKGLDTSLLRVEVLPALEGEETPAEAVPVGPEKKEEAKKPRKKRAEKEKKADAVEIETSEAAEYERLERAAEEDGAYHSIFGAIGTAARVIKEGFKPSKSLPDIETMKRKHGESLAKALNDKFEWPIDVVGTRLGWSDNEKKAFSEGIIRKGIEKYLK